MEKSVDAFRTISEVAEELALPQHVLRFWETRFPQVKPLKRAGGRRYYRPGDVILLRTIRQLLYEEGFTIKGVQKLIKEQGTRAVREGSVPMPVDLATIDAADRDPDGELVADEAPSFAPTSGADPLPDSIRAALDAGIALQSTRLGPRDLAALREALATIDECTRVLQALRRPR
jgi:DNA-binding transcriptional MerR regulator